MYYNILFIVFLINKGIYINIIIINIKSNKKNIHKIYNNCL